MENKKTLIDLQKEYQQMCLNAGQLQYQIYVLTKDLEKLNSAMVEVNNEGAKLQQEEASKKVTEQTPSEISVESKE